MDENNNKNIFPLILILAVILILVGGAYWYSQQMKKSEIEEAPEPTGGISIIEAPESTEAEEEIEEAVEEAEETVEEEPEEEAEAEETDAEVVEIFQQLFAEKYDRDSEDATVTITEREGGFFVGGIKFEGEIGGGYLLGAKVDGEWMILFDGNGNYTCEDVDSVDFPVSLAPECWDEATQTLVTR